MKNLRHSRSHERFVLMTLGRKNARGEWVEPSMRLVLSSDAQQRSSVDPATKFVASLPHFPRTMHVQRNISNRHSGRLETAVSCSKQKTAHDSNRHFLGV
jgi:hypothetical protein